MKLFRCQHCAQLLYFENHKCEKCGHRLGYIAEAETLSALDPEGDNWRALAFKNKLYRFCSNAQYDACNWLIPADTSDRFCVACSHNRTVPDLSGDENCPTMRRDAVGVAGRFRPALRLQDAMHYLAPACFIISRATIRRCTSVAPS